MFRNVHFHARFTPPVKQFKETVFLTQVIEGQEVSFVSRETPTANIPRPCEYTLSSLREAKIPMDKITPNYGTAPTDIELERLNGYIDRNTEKDNNRELNQTTE